MSSKLNWGLLLYCVLKSHSLSEPKALSTQIIVWNVGQGQWVTVSTMNQCLHFDAGGENSPPQSKLKFFCEFKTNAFFLSHFDSDHVNMLHKLMRIFPGICKSGRVYIKKQNANVRLHESMPECASIGSVQKLYPKGDFQFTSTNANSLVHSVLNVLIPGDSSIQQEKIWASENIFNNEILILGHHGSQTSTSDYLLSRLPNLRMAIASSRQARYGHPHIKVIKKIRQKKAPLLTTEKWGHIIIELKNESYSL